MPPKKKTGTRTNSSKKREVKVIRRRPAASIKEALALPAGWKRIWHTFPCGSEARLLIDPEGKRFYTRSQAENNLGRKLKVISASAKPHRKSSPASGLQSNEAPSSEAKPDRSGNASRLQGKKLATPHPDSTAPTVETAGGLHKSAAKKLRSSEVRPQTTSSASDLQNNQTHASPQRIPCQQEAPGDGETSFEGGVSSGTSSSVRGLQTTESVTPAESAAQMEEKVRELFTAAAKKLRSSEESLATLKPCLDALPHSSLALHDEEDCSLLHIAAGREDDVALPLCKHILQLGPVPCMVEDVAAALFFAVQAGNYGVCEYLVSLKHDVNCVNMDGRTPLFEAISSHTVWHEERGYITAKNLIRLRADVHHVDDKKQTVLFVAAEYTDNSNCVALLLDARACPQVQDSMGRTPIFNAAAAGNASAIDLLVKASADPHKVDQSKMNALRLAIKNSKNHATMVLLSDHGVGLPPFDAHPFSSDEHGDGTCMSMAKDRGLHEVVAYLSSMRACYENARGGTYQEFERALKLHPGGLGLDEHGRNLLFGVASRTTEEGTLDMLKLLMTSWGWSVDESDYSQKTPLFLAAERGSVSSVKFLLQSRADANALDASGFCPLYYALRNKPNETVVAALAKRMDAYTQAVVLQQVGQAVAASTG